MADAIRPANHIVNTILRLTVGNIVRLRFHARFDAGVLGSVKPPYLLIGNHTCNWDAFLMSFAVKAPIHFVASDEYFRTPLLRFLLHLVGGIPKTKNTSDLQPIRTMIALKKVGAILGIYPEGNRNWDGVTGPLFESTAKLVKLFRIPVIAVVTTGGSLSDPRWARHPRTGRMHLDFHLLFTPEDCKTLSEAEIHVKMVEALAHDDHPASEARAAANKEPFRFHGKRLAERLELFLFQCASCKQVNTLATHEDILHCTACGLTVRYGEDGRLHPDNPFSSTSTNTPDSETTSASAGTLSAASFKNPLFTAPVPFALTRDWNRWQCANLQSAIQNHLPFPALSPVERDPILLGNDDAHLQTGGKLGDLVHVGTGTLHLHPDRLIFYGTDAPESILTFPLDGITGLNIQYNNRVEFYHQDVLYRFSFPIQIVSVWKWHQALLYACEAQHTTAPKGGTRP